ncbi:glycosyltransferase family 2 protein [Methylotenera sp. G11]|uniref:glycosyltransferase family 2 protein n=1 Tax=Methylotenera sp. G11 TaxID=1506585 RepID=UPI000646B9B7|nr:glycosyltransferase family 2 protein [Methylotenera sp. G11]
MKISIVTISYNQAQFLERAILSVINQKYSNIEYIVVDPGSTDGSREIIEKYRNKISKVVFEKDAGAADGLNKGFAYATGDIFYFLNSDDELLPDAFNKIVKFLTANPTVDAVSGCGYFTNAEGKRLRRIVPSKLTSWLYVHGGVSVFQQGTFFRANYFNKVRGFNVENKTCWDGELFLDMSLAGAKFATIGDDLAHFCLHDGGITGSGRLEEQYKKDTMRLFVKGTGRQRNAFDSIQDTLARIVKGIVDPAYYFRRISTFFS